MSHSTGEPREAAVTAVGPGESVPSLLTPALAGRRDRLARGLEGLGVLPDDRVMVLCCSRHRDDMTVAEAALNCRGAIPVKPASWDAPSSVRRLAASVGTHTYLACQEGVDLWRASGVLGRMIGDGQDVMWWKALEARHAQTMDAAGAAENAEGDARYWKRSA